MSRFLETHPKIAAAVFGGVLLLCATLAVSGQCVPNTLTPPVGVGDAGTNYVAGSFYACPSKGQEADWRETVNSPTLNAGNSALGSAYEYDLMGNNRNSFGTAWDMGSYQFIPVSLGTVQ